MESRRYPLRHLTYHVITAGAGPALLLLHGFTGSAENWMLHIPHLATRFRVIVPDLPGHGASDSPAILRPYQFSAVEYDLRHLLNQLAGWPVRILGYSMGGRLALYLALMWQRDLKALVLESASPGLATSEERQARRVSDEALARRIEQLGITAFVDEWEQLPLWQSQARLPVATRQALRQLRLRNSADGLAYSLRGMGTGAQPALWRSLSYLNRPALLIAGQEDAKFLAIAQQMQVGLPHASLAVVPQAGHATHLEQPEIFVKQVLGFLTHGQ